MLSLRAFIECPNFKFRLIMQDLEAFRFHLKVNLLFSVNFFVSALANLDICWIITTKFKTTLQKSVSFWKSYKCTMINVDTMKTIFMAGSIINRINGLPPGVSYSKKLKLGSPVKEINHFWNEIVFNTSKHTNVRLGYAKGWFFVMKFM